ncbi:hypothetical protein B296_00043157 [Ensete ventricosum]|uniref:Uncharacterized protein n=1 Tax=Ensete ventricosum TaxID=4639 RepID=A0A426XQI6_ENSVE|nr:hypothetical protein B296_00043157 [Ensete ventricosum]
MRLNRIEPFYVFLLHFRSERSEERLLATARPPLGSIVRGRPRAWLAPIGVGSACKDGASPQGWRSQGCASPQGRRLQAQHPQELPLDGQRRLLQRRPPMGKVATR